MVKRSPKTLIHWRTWINSNIEFWTRGSLLNLLKNSVHNIFLLIDKRLPRGWTIWTLYLICVLYYIIAILEGPSLFIPDLRLFPSIFIIFVIFHIGSFFSCVIYIYLWYSILLFISYLIKIIRVQSEHSILEVHKM